MQDAGRILLMPKGDYSADVTYEMLDLVNHGGASWVCKKDCTGQEPSDSNTEFWQRFGTAVDLSNYLQKSGGVVEAPTPHVMGVKNTTGTDCYVNFNGKDGLLGYLGFYGYEPAYINGNTKAMKMLLHTGNMASHVLPLEGGTVASPNIQPMYVQRNGNGNVYLGYKLNGAEVGGLGFSAKDKPAVYLSTSIYDILHTGNKPTGTYTGNGDATTRMIQTGGIGSMALIESSANYDFILVTRGGYFGVKQTQFVHGTDAYWDTNYNAIVTRAVNSLFNVAGVTYTYHVY